MELSTTLTGQRQQYSVREVGINPNYWYPVSWTKDLQPQEVISVVVWQQTIAVYRDSEGGLHALEDACPHKGVELHKGEVQGENLTCPYHGWQFDGNGECVHIPYFPKDQKLPCARARSYPVQAKYDIIWVFPGDPALSDRCQIPEVPEYGDPEFFMVHIPGYFKAHFSICNENSMDVFHGFLHKDLQGWFDPILVSLRRTKTEVCADYRVSYQGLLTKVLGISDGSEGVTTRTASVRYQYPHYHSSLEGLSSIHLMRLPVGPGLTRSFSLMFLKLPLPRWLTQGPLKSMLEKLFLNSVFLKFLAQDVEMMESEQRTYITNPQRHYVEVNPAILALQQVIVGQYEQFMQQSKHPQGQQNGSNGTFLPVTEVAAAE